MAPLLGAKPRLDDRAVGVLAGLFGTHGAVSVALSEGKSMSGALSTAADRDRPGTAGRVTTDSDGMASKAMFVKATASLASRGQTCNTFRSHEVDCSGTGQSSVKPLDE